MHTPKQLRQAFPSITKLINIRSVVQNHYIVTVSLHIYDMISFSIEDCWVTSNMI